MCCQHKNIKINCVKYVDNTYVEWYNVFTTQGGDEMLLSKEKRELKELNELISKLPSETRTKLIEALKLGKVIYADPKNDEEKEAG